MWPDGNEVEVDSHFEQFYRFMSGDSQVDNPRDMRVTKVSKQISWTHGLSTNWALRFELPFAVAHRKERSGSTTYSSIENVGIAFSWRIDPLIWGKPYTFKGGSFRVGLYGRVKLPTAKKRGLALVGEKMSFGDETFNFRFGALTGLSTDRYYAWSELSVDAYTRKDGTGKGAGVKAHFALARRVIQLKDYREADLILLVEFDVEYRGKGELNGEVNHNSGYFKTHIALGTQLNITNIWEVKFGYNLPLYRTFEGRQFVHDGVLAASVNYLF